MSACSFGKTGNGLPLGAAVWVPSGWGITFRKAKQIPVLSLQRAIFVSGKACCGCCRRWFSTVDLPSGLAEKILQALIRGAFRLGPVQRFVNRMYGVVVILGKPESRGQIRHCIAFRK